MLTAEPRRTRTAISHDPEGPTLVERLRRLQQRNEVALWLVPILLLLGAMAAASVRGAL